MLGKAVVRKLRAQVCGAQIRAKLCARRLAATGALALAILFAAASSGLATDKAAIWRALASEGHVALLRHAIAPGVGDPREFMIGDCGSQRNLSEEGRKQARRIGARLRENGIESARVFSSQWCRCLETARLLGVGPVSELAILNSFFQRPERRERQTRGLEEWLAGQALDGSLVLVTHQVNITALTGVFPASGELVVIRRSENGGISVVGSIQTD
jgi:phosphohistidine phosphatase SixA